MPTARVVVFGYGRLALAALDTCARIGVTPTAVVVPSNRQSPDVDMVVARARERGHCLLVQPPRTASAPFLEAVRALRPDILLVWSYSMLLSDELVALAPLGAVNVHGGLLPEYRGGHVMNWAIINGDAESGVTLHYIDSGIDTGPVIATERFPIESRDDAASVMGKIESAGELLLTTWWPAIANGTAPKANQDESRARYYRLRTAADGLIDWTQPNVAIHNQVRALVAPWPGAFTSVQGTKLVVRRSRPVDLADPTSLPGTIRHCDEHGVLVTTGSGALQLLSLEIDDASASFATLRDAGVAAGVQLR